MTNSEYKEMYIEQAFETGEVPSEAGYKRFVAWRKRVEAFFAERDNQAHT